MIFGKLVVMLDLSFSIPANYLHHKCDIVIVPESKVWFLYPCNSCCIFRRKSNYIGLLSNFLPTCFSYSSINRTALFIYSDFGVMSILGKLHNVQDSLKD